MHRSSYRGSELACRVLSPRKEDDTPAYEETLALAALPETLTERREPLTRVVFP